MSYCKICNKPIKAYQGRNRTKCSGCFTKIRRYRAKQAAIQLLGGTCQRCGYNAHPAALEFHHKDPSKKDFALGTTANKSWAVVKKEVLKCELLCSNCHRIEHSNMEDPVFLKEVQNYKGKLLK